MKFLLFTIFLGVAYASTLDPKNEGEWRLVKVAANNKDKVAEDGPLRVFLEKINCQDKVCHKVDIFFDAKENGEFQPFYLVGDKDKDHDYYTTDYQGKNYFGFPYQSETALVICVKNTDENGVVTFVAEIAVRPGENPTEEDKAAFVRLLKEHNIPESQVFNLSQEDPCP